MFSIQPFVSFLGTFHPLKPVISLPPTTPHNPRGGILIISLAVLCQFLALAGGENAEHGPKFHGFLGGLEQSESVADYTVMLRV